MNTFTNLSAFPRTILIDALNDFYQRVEDFQDEEKFFTLSDGSYYLPDELLPYIGGLIADLEEASQSPEAKNTLATSNICTMGCGI